MEIDSRFPAIQADQRPLADREEGVGAPPQDVAAAGGTNASDFFISPVLRFDSRSLTVIFQVRDSGSGDVVRQFPPETVVERYRQDPTAKPFTLSPGTASGRDDQSDDAVAQLLAPFPEAGEEPATAAEPAPSRDAPLTRSEPVDLVA